MPTEYDRDLQASVTRDDAGRIRGVFYFDKLHKMENVTGREAAEKYIRSIAAKLDLEPEALRSIDHEVSYDQPREQGIEYRFSEEKSSFDTTTYIYSQTYLNTPVWTGGISVEVKQPRADAHASIVALTDTSISLQVSDTNGPKFTEAKLPSPIAIDRYDPLIRGKDDQSVLAKVLGGAAKRAITPDEPWLIKKGRFFIYRYDAKLRQVGYPRLSLPPVPKSIRDHNWYLAAELICRLPSGPTHNNWRILVELETGAVLSARGMSSGIKANVFKLDPVTRGYNVKANRGEAVLKRRQQLEELRNLTPPHCGHQSLEGRFAKVVNLTSPDFDVPTRPEGLDFDNFDVRSNEFAAVSAYYQVDRFFQLVEDLGFQVIGPNSYFKDTDFPVKVDHRAFRVPWPDGNVVNAALEGHGQGIDRVYFALAEFSGGRLSKVTPATGGSGYTSATKVTFRVGDRGGFGARATAVIQDGRITGVTLGDQKGAGYMVPPFVEFKDEGGGTGAWAVAEIDVEKPIGMATDWRVTLHELGGHGTLWCHVEDDQFKFAHSAGDSFAMILTDYVSSWHGHNPHDYTPYLPFNKPDRYLLLPFEPGVVPRRADRGVREQSLARVDVADAGDGYLTVTLGPEGEVRRIQGGRQPCGYRGWRHQSSDCGRSRKGLYERAVGQFERRGRHRRRRVCTVRFRFRDDQRNRYEKRRGRLLRSSGCQLHWRWPGQAGRHEQAYYRWQDHQSGRQGSGRRLYGDPDSDDHWRGRPRRQS